MGDTVLWNDRLNQSIYSKLHFFTELPFFPDDYPHAQILKRRIPNGGRGELRRRCPGACHGTVSRGAWGHATLLRVLPHGMPQAGGGTANQSTQPPTLGHSQRLQKIGDQVCDWDAGVHSAQRPPKCTQMHPDAPGKSPRRIILPSRSGT